SRPNSHAATRAAPRRPAGRLPRTGTQSRDSVAGPTPSIVLLRRPSLPLHNRTLWRRHHEGEDLRGHPRLRILGCGMLAETEPLDKSPVAIGRGCHVHVLCAFVIPAPSKYSADEDTLISRDAACSPFGVLPIMSMRSYRLRLTGKQVNCGVVRR